MASILQLAVRPRLGPLGYTSQLPMHLPIKRSSQRLAPPGKARAPCFLEFSIANTVLLPDVLPLAEEVVEPSTQTATLVFLQELQ